ncbi:MAG: carboxymuconolactone decarboxylase family protein [Nitrospira sp.]
MGQLPTHYQSEQRHQEEFIAAVEALGKALKAQGPVETKWAHLLQLAASVAIHSEGAVHSHVRQALDNGATCEEIRHAVILLTSTLGSNGIRRIELGGRHHGET